jgi:hypothetical protein
MLSATLLRFRPGQKAAAADPPTFWPTRILRVTGLQCASPEISGGPDNAMRIHRHSYSSRAANVTPPGRTRTQNSNRLANQPFWLARSAWPHSASSSCPRWSSPRGPLRISPPAATGVKSCEDVSLTWSGSTIVGSASCALPTMNSEPIVRRLDWRGPARLRRGTLPGRPFPQQTRGRSL